jgi:hypothetical protein
MPASDEAFTSIRSCGGNQIRCGGSDYRVGSAEPGTTLACVVILSSKVRVIGRVSSASGAHFEVSGDIERSGGSVTVSAGARSDGSMAELEPTTCTVTKVQFLVAGGIWADFDCSPGGDAGGCAARGTFVFERCLKEADAGP